MTATYRGEEYRGIVHDISSAGISCTIGSEAGGAEAPDHGILNPLHISCADWGIVVPRQDRDQALAWRTNGLRRPCSIRGTRGVGLRR
jgi:hypothetical protein